MAFLPSAIEKNSAAIQRFYRAYWEAAQKINANPDAYRSMLVESLSFPKEAAAAFVFPRYMKPRLPSIASIEEAAQWLYAKGLIKRLPNIDSILDGRMVQGW